MFIFSFDSGNVLFLRKGQMDKVQFYFTTSST